MEEKKTGLIFFKVYLVGYHLSLEYCTRYHNKKAFFVLEGVN